MRTHTRPLRLRDVALGAALFWKAARHDRDWRMAWDVTLLLWITYRAGLSRAQMNAILRALCAGGTQAQAIQAAKLARWQ